MEEALYEITPMRQFARLTLSAPIPEEGSKVWTGINLAYLFDTSCLGPIVDRSGLDGSNHAGNRELYDVSDYG